MFWEKIGNSVSDRLFRVSVRDSVIAENQCLYIIKVNFSSSYFDMSISKVKATM